MSKIIPIENWVGTVDSINRSINITNLRRKLAHRYGRQGRNNAALRRMVAVAPVTAHEKAYLRAVYSDAKHHTTFTRRYIQ